MSIISDLGEGFKNLPKIIDTYDGYLKDAEEKIKFKGKLDEALSQNSAWLYYYDQRKTEMHSLVKFFKTEEDKVRSTLFRSYKENYSRSLGEREVLKYIDGEDSYLKIHSLLIEIEELYEQYQAVVEAFKTRHYALSNITKLRIASLDNLDL